MANEITFHSWDHDQNEVIEWERLGECNQCGECCTAMIRFNVAGERFETLPDGTLMFPTTNVTPKSGGTTTDGKGLWHSITRGNLTRFFEVTEQGEIGSHYCPQLLGNNRCAVQSNKTLFNKVWPMHPNQVTPYPNCSYKFDEVARWRLDEL